MALHRSRTPHVREIVNGNPVNHSNVAPRLCVPRTVWSARVNGRHARTPLVRRCILAWAVFVGVPRAEMLERVEAPLREAH